MISHKNILKWKKVLINHYSFSIINNNIDKIKITFQDSPFEKYSYDADLSKKSLPKIIFFFFSLNFKILNWFIERKINKMYKEQERNDKKWENNN